MATSAQSVNNFVTPSADSIFSQMENVISNVYKTSESNSARSAEEASNLRAWQERQNKIAMDFNAQEAQKNRDWQKMMSDTAHQREIADLKAAGLNPILSAGGGNGASVGSGATASAVTSSGAKGDVDTSANQAIVNLLSTMLSAQNSMEQQRMSAVTNMAIAERNNSAAQILQSMKQDHEEYMQKNYPSNAYQAINSLASALLGSSGGVIPSVSSAKDKVSSVVDSAVSFVKDFFKSDGFEGGYTRGGGVSRRR